MKLLIVFILFALALSKTTKQKISNLPGYSGPPLNQYSGYVEVGETGRNIFYWYIESTGSAHDDPLVVWFQGGPGCSGLDGLFSENGPFRIQPNLDLHFTNLVALRLMRRVGCHTPTCFGSNNLPVLDTATLQIQLTTPRMISKRRLTIFMFWKLSSTISSRSSRDATSGSQVLSS